MSAYKTAGMLWTQMDACRSQLMLRTEVLASLTLPHVCLPEGMTHENYTITAGHRARSGHAVYLFAPFSETRNTARWNPLGYIPDDPALRKRLDDIGLEPIGSTPEQLAAVQKADLAKWEKPVRATGYQAD